MVERCNDRVPRDLEPATQIIPDRDAELVACLDETEESIATIPADVASRPGTDLAPRDVTADVVFGAVGVERYFGPVQYHQQLGLVGVQPRQQAIQRGEACAAKEDAIEACAQRLSPPLAGFQLISSEVRVEVPDEATSPRLGVSVLVVERIQFMHKPFRVNPTQRMLADVELPGIVTQNHGIAQEFVRLNAAP